MIIARVSGFCLFLHEDAMEQVVTIITVFATGLVAVVAGGPLRQQVQRIKGILIMDNLRSHT